MKGENKKMKCSSCGFEFEGGKFCPQCGAKVEEAVAEAVVEAAAPVVEAAAEPVVEAVQAAEPVVEAAAEPVVEAAATAAGAEAGTMPVYTDYSSYDNAEEKKGINTLGLVAMILGIVSLVAIICGCCIGTSNVVFTVLKFILIFARIIMSIVAIILGIAGMKKRPDQKGMAIAGLVLGIIGLLLGGLSLILTIIGLVSKAALGGLTSTPGFQEYLEELQDSLESTY